MQCIKRGRLLFHEVCFINSVLTLLDFKGSEAVEYLFNARNQKSLAKTKLR